MSLGETGIKCGVDFQSPRGPRATYAHCPRPSCLRISEPGGKVFSSPSREFDKMSSALDHQEPPSPPLSRSAGPSNLDSDERPRKRVRTDDSEVKKPVRRRMACQSCRIRKVKCDNARPTCAICTNSGSECVYIDATPATAYVLQDSKYTCGVY